MAKVVNRTLQSTARSTCWQGPSSIRAMLLGVIILGLSACAGGERFTPLARTSVNFAAHSPLGVRLPAGDQRALEPIFIQAVSRGRNGERFDWRGPDSFGWVKGGERLLGGISAPALPYPEGLYLGDSFETDLGLYALTRNANVRTGPSTEFSKLQQLTSGTGVEVVGRVIGKPWMLVAVEGQIVGYVHANLMIKAPGSELDLAGGPTRRAVPCRAFEQRISFTGRSDRWDGVACEEEGQWVLQAVPENAPVPLY